MIVDVLVELKTQGIDQTFSYLVPKELEKEIEVGKRVEVPFSSKTLEGFILRINENKEIEYKLKEIIKIIDEKPILNEELLELGKYMSLKTLSNLISCYQTMLPTALKAKINSNINKKYITYLKINKLPEKLTEKQQIIIDLFKTEKILKKQATDISVYTTKSLIEKNILKEIQEETYRLNDEEEIIDNKIILNEEQEYAIKEVTTNLNNFKPYLLYGVTGSGKTEVYMNIIKEVIKNKKQALVLVPEISLTPGIIKNFKNRFGNVIAILHSGLSNGEKFDEYRKIQNNEVSIVIGARSAVFAPLNNIGIIIIDEEHSNTYKQDNNPRYNAIDIALYRAKKYNCPVILGSATPQIESFTRAKQEIYHLLELKKRVFDNVPKSHLIDMKNEIKKGNPIFSNTLKEKINDRLNKKEQIILLLNRRGFTTIITCHNCGYKSNCPNCDIPLTYHKKSNLMRCHYCGHTKPKISKCPDCNSTDINEFGMGTEKLEQLVNENFNARVIRMDVDTTTKKGAHEKILNSFKNHEFDILIGTQMIAKGLDFHNVTLVGIMNADASLNIPDFRSGERTFQLINQVSGRAGRGLKAGEVVIQGFNVDNYSIKKASENNYLSFYQEEMHLRKILKYPPFYNLVLIKISGKDLNLLYEESNKMITHLKTQIEDHQILLGPTPSNMPKINNIYYLQIIIKYKKSTNLLKHLNYINNIYRKNNKVRVEIDVNPMNL